MIDRLTSQVPGLASLRWRLTFAITGVVLLCTAASLVGAVLFLRGTLTDRARSDLQHTLSGVSGYLDNTQSDLRGTAKLVATDPAVASALGRHDKGRMVVHLTPFFADLNADILDVIDANGRVLVRMEDTQTSGDSVMGRLSIRRALQGKETVAADNDPTQAGSEGYAVRATVPIKSGGHVTGVVVVGRVLGSIFASRIGHALNANVNLIAGSRRTGTTLTDTNGLLEEGINEPGPVLQRITTGRTSVAQTTEDGQTVLSGIVPLKNDRGVPIGGVEIVRALDPVYDVIRSLSWLLLLLGALVIAIGTFMALSISRRLTSRISVLDTTASRVAAMAGVDAPLGKLHVAEAVQGNDEVASLARSFASMMESLDKHMAENTRLYEASQSRVRELTGLAEIARLLTGVSSVRETLDILGQHVCRLVGCQAVAIWLPSPGEELPALHGGYGLPPGYEELARDTIRPNGSSNVWQIASREALVTGEVVLRDLAAEPEEYMTGSRGELRQILLDQGWRRATAVPLRLQERIVGALSCFSSGTEPLAGAELSLLLTIADQVAVAVENSRLSAEAQARAALQAALEERRLGEEALRASELRYRTMIEQSPRSIQIFAPDGTAIQANRAWEQLFGLSIDVLPDYNILEDPQLREPGLRDAIGAIFNGESRAIPRLKYDVEVHGSERPEPFRWIRAFGYPVKDTYGRVREVIIMHEDITEQVLAEEQLHETEEQYRSVFEASMDGLIIGDPEGNFIEANPAMCEMHGYTREEMLRIAPPMIVHPDDYPVFGEYYETILAGGSYHTRATDIRKDGTTFPVEVRGSGFMYRGRRHVLGVVRDITERVEAERQLRAQEAQYRGIFQATSDALLIVDEEGLIVEVNRAASTLYGFSQEEFAERGAWLDLDAVRAVLDEGRAYSGREINYRKDGTPVHIEGRVTRLVYRGEAHFLVVARDVTQQVEAFETLEQRVQERTRELTTLLGVSHDVASTLELEPLLGLILDQIPAVVQYDGAAILSVQGGNFMVLDRRTPDGSDDGPDFYSLEGARPIVEVLRKGKPVLVEDIRGEAALGEAYRESLGIYTETVFGFERSLLIVPMMVKDRMIGALSLSHSQPGYYGQRHAALIAAIANQAAVAIENARLYEQAQEVAVLEERQRLARELHDSVSQALYGIALGAKTAKTLLERDPSKAGDPLEYVLAQAQAGLTEMRALIFELRPESLEAEGLVVALAKQAESLRVRHNLEVRTEFVDEPDVSMVVKEAIYRIAQEAMHNSVKHARARSVGVRLSRDGDALEVEISDDGAGFDPNGAFPGHLGLRTMRERAIRLGGSFTITSAPGEGTSIVASVPGRVTTGESVAPASR